MDNQNVMEIQINGEWREAVFVSVVKNTEDELVLRTLQSAAYPSREYFLYKQEGNQVLGRLPLQNGFVDLVKRSENISIVLLSKLLGSKDFFSERCLHAH